VAFWAHEPRNAHNLALGSIIRTSPSYQVHKTPAGQGFETTMRELRSLIFRDDVIERLCQQMEAVSLGF